jgi:hypothetical protein
VIPDRNEFFDQNQLRNEVLDRNFAGICNLEYEYYGLLVRDNLDSMMDDEELREMYESDGDSAPSKDSTRWYASLLR